jgi:hypothetical protein
MDCIKLKWEQNHKLVDGKEFIFPQNMNEIEKNFHLELSTKIDSFYFKDSSPNSVRMIPYWKFKPLTLPCISKSILEIISSIMDTDSKSEMIKELLETIPERNGYYQIYRWIEQGLQDQKHDLRNLYTMKEINFPTIKKNVVKSFIPHSL